MMFLVWEFNKLSETFNKGIFDSIQISQKYLRYVKRSSQEQTKTDTM